MSEASAKATQSTVRRLDRDRLMEVVKETSTWPAYRRAELGTKAPSRIDTKPTSNEPSANES